MKIVFDAFWWSEGPISNRNVMQEIIREWRTSFPQDEMHVVATQDAKADVASELGLPDGCVHAAKMRQHGLAVLLEYPLILRRLEPDHILTHNFVPLFTRRVSTFVHDLIFMTSPQWFTRSELMYFWLLRKSLRRSWQLFSSTRSEASRVDRLAGSVSITHPTGLAVSTELAAAVPQKPQLGVYEYGYSLIVGRLNQRKNLAYGLGVLATSGIISPARPVLVVGERHGKTSELPPDVRSMVESGAIRFVGFMQLEELAWLYSKASLVVFPTLDEGFGLPVIEARYFGAPLALSDIPVLREVAGDADSCFFSLEDKALAAATLAAASLRTSPADDAGSRAALVSQYSWKSTVDAIRSTLSKHIADSDQVGGL